MSALCGALVGILAFFVITWWKLSKRHSEALLKLAKAEGVNIDASEIASTMVSAMTCMAAFESVTEELQYDILSELAEASDHLDTFGGTRLTQPGWQRLIDSSLYAVNGFIAKHEKV